MTVRLLRLLLLLLPPLLGACDSATGPSLPPGAERFVPPAVYRQWWALTQACSRRSESVDVVSWYVVPGAETILLDDGSPVHGRWDSQGNRIVLAGGSWLYGDLVRHEMLHALLRTGDHPRAQFLGRCAGVVACVERCIADGGPPPPADPAAVPADPSALEIGVEATPEAPSSGQNGGHFVMVVTARNPSSQSLLIVQLPPSGDAGPSASFSYRIVGEGGGGWYYAVRADVPEVTRFVAGETKRFVFDLRIGAGESRYDLRPGTYRFEGAYGDVWAPNPPTVTIAP